MKIQTQQFQIITATKRRQRVADLAEAELYTKIIIRVRVIYIP